MLCSIFNIIVTQKDTFALILNKFYAVCHYYTNRYIMLSEFYKIVSTRR